MGRDLAVATESPMTLDSLEPSFKLKSAQCSGHLLLQTGKRHSTFRGHRQDPSHSRIRLVQTRSRMQTFTVLKRNMDLPISLRCQCF